MERAGVMKAIWAKYRAAGHTDTSATEHAITPSTDLTWTKDSSTYEINYNVDPDFGVIVYLEVVMKININPDSKVVADVLNNNYTNMPKTTSKEAQINIAKWAGRKINQPQYVKVKNKGGVEKTYWYSAYKRREALAWRIGHTIRKNKKIKNRSGFLKPFERKNGMVDKAVNRAIARFMLSSTRKGWHIPINKRINKVLTFD